MMSLHDIRDLVSSLFIMLNKKTYVLFRIEFLVVLVVLLFLAMFIADFFRRYIHNSTMRAAFSIFDAVSDSIVLYLMGAMQTAPFKNQLFPVWAIVLVNFRYSADFISAFGVNDQRGRRFNELRNVVKLLGSAFLNSTRGSRFAGPLWSLWAVQILRSSYRMLTRTLALASLWHGRSSVLVAEYMRADNERSTWKPEHCDPDTMEGYKYLVYGETMHGVKLQKPRYILCVGGATTAPGPGEDTDSIAAPGPGEAGSQESSTSNKRRSPLITLDKIWRSEHHLLNPAPSEDQVTENDHEAGKDLKDVSLALALSRLLRCRLEDLKLQGNTFCINRKLVKKRIINEEPKRAFSIMGMQLAFLNDYFNTRYPMVFWSGLISLLINLLASTVTVGVVCWLAVDIYKVNRPPDGELFHRVHGDNVDMIITWVFMFFMVFKEVWEMVVYLLSDWTRLLLTCFYTHLKGKRTTHGCLESVVLFFFRCKIISKSWHGNIDQYVFLESYGDRPYIWNLFHNLTTGMLPEKDDGAKLGSAISVPEYVGPAILNKLSSLDLTDPAGTNSAAQPTDSHGGQLPRGITFTSLPDDNKDRRKRYGWACFDLPTCSHIILVWHIATSLCEMDIAMGHGVNLGDPGFPFSLLSWLTGCCSSKNYLMDVGEKKKKKQQQQQQQDVEGRHGYQRSLFSRITDCCSSSKSNGKKNEAPLPEELKKRYIVANSLSRYCAYLLVSEPDLIQDSFLVPKMVFRRAVKDTRDNILKGCGTLKSRYIKLMEEGKDMKKAKDMKDAKKMKEAEGAAKDADAVKEDEGKDVVRLGAMLGWELINHESLEARWEILAEVWADLLVHMAATWKAEAHKKCLESGGEFITHIWALLWHCGVHKSSLWPEENASETNVHGAPQDNNAGNSNVEKQEAGADTRNGQIRVDVSEEDVTEIPDEELEESNPRRTPKEREGAKTQRSQMQQAGEQMTNSWTETGTSDTLELETTRIAVSKDNKGLLTADTSDGGHRTGLANRHGNVVRGIKNLGNTCYFNAVLQSLLALDKLRAMMSGLDSPRKSLRKELKYLFKETSDANTAEGTLVPENLFSYVCSRNPDFKRDVMEDSNNLLGSLLDGLNNEEPTVVETLFRGQVDKHVSCKECEHTTITTGGLDLNLAIPSEKKPVSIENCLDLYITGTTENWHCKYCSVAAGNATTVVDDQTEESDSETHQKEQPIHSAEKQTSTPNQDKGKLPMLNGDTHQMKQSHDKQSEKKKICGAASLKHRIIKAPPILTIQLKRFHYVHPNRSDKLNERVSFPETLDITKYMDASNLEDGKPKYCLVAVIVHDGANLHAGHNFAYVRRASKIGVHGQESSGAHSWFRASDESITEVHLEQVLDCEAYILFYERVE